MLPDLASLANLRERDLRQDGCFVTEGRLLTERALRASWPLEQVLCVPRWAEHFSALTQGRCALTILDEPAMMAVVGFPFHRGVLGTGRRPSLPCPGDVAARAHLLVGLPEVNTVENLGALFRSASALGADGILLGERCSDPLARRALKASAGSVFTLPFAESADLLETLLGLQAAGWRVAGAVPDRQATDLRDYQPAERTLLLFGNEADGLGADYLARCDDRVTIPMVGDMDSLNLAVAASIVLYALADRMGRLQRSPSGPHETPP
jgi:tRNA G18 (ribose-2'-O)-methylase SpoU